MNYFKVKVQTCGKTLSWSFTYQIKMIKNVKKDIRKDETK